MRILLDTHIALWAIADTSKLSDEAAKKHNDPFDRLLLSQAIYDGLIFITHDELIPGYNENCVMKV